MWIKCRNVAHGSLNYLSENTSAPETDSLSITYDSATGDNTTASNINGLPDSCLQAVVIKACLNILQAYISDFVQDEEDNEMLSMLSTQMQSLQGLFQSEMARFTEQDKQPRGE